MASGLAAGARRRHLIAQVGNETARASRPARPWWRASPTAGREAGASTPCRSTGWRVASGRRLALKAPRIGIYKSWSPLDRRGWTRPCWTTTSFVHEPRQRRDPEEGPGQALRRDPDPRPDKNVIVDGEAEERGRGRATSSRCRPSTRAGSARTGVASLKAFVQAGHAGVHVGRVRAGARRASTCRCATWSAAA